MKNILVLTNTYCAPDLPQNYTPVVHYFAREWVKMGYNVRVVFFESNFPSFYYTLTKPINKRLASWLKADVIKDSLVPDMTYEMDGVKISRIGIKKIIPHSNISDVEFEKAYNQTLSICEKESFEPDIILSHWANPCIKVMTRLKAVYNCRTSYVCHGAYEMNIYKDKVEDLIRDVDIIGYRSDYIKKEFEKAHPHNKPTFRCFSGIPEEYTDSMRKKYFSGVRNFIYVGNFIARKHPAAIPPALKKAFQEDAFLLNYIGAGAEEKNIKKASIRAGIQDNVVFNGRVSRDKVVEMMDNSDIFIMISESEAFGLVYLEAMARGCITIASRKEGFDGIIQDGVNGFLCEAGDSEELAAIITRIRKMSNDELQIISDNAIKTSCELTDKKVAKAYIENVLNLTEFDNRNNIING